MCVGRATSTLGCIYGSREVIATSLKTLRLSLQVNLVETPIKKNKIVGMYNIKENKILGIYKISSLGNTQ